MARANTKPSAGTQVLEFDTDAIKRREKEVARETDEQILERLGERFQILTEMTKAVKQGDIRAMIVSGPPGVGKSFGVEAVLQKDGLFDAMSALGLYAKLYEFSAEKNVVVFDDCDGVLMDELSLNILKGALDSSKKRYIAWNTDSRLLRSEGIPDRFEFKGSAIFITNIKFEHVRSKKLRDHLDALESRCHYIDLQMDTAREKILRIKQVVKENEMLADYEFEACVQDEIVEFVEANQDKLREARTTCMKRA